MLINSFVSRISLVACLANIETKERAVFLSLLY